MEATYTILGQYDLIEKEDEYIDPGYFVWKEVPKEYIGRKVKEASLLNKDPMEVRRLKAD